MLILEFVRDFLNLIDAFSIISFISIQFFEIIMKQNNGSMHHLKVFYVLRGIRLLRFLEYTHVLFYLIKKNISTFIYSHFLFLILMFMFALFGFQFFGGKIIEINEITSAYNFNTLSGSFMTVFNIITLENWYSTYVEISRNAKINIYLLMTYFLSLIIVGHLLIYHFFLAIMLDVFESAKNLDSNEIVDDEIYPILLKYLKNDKETKNNEDSLVFSSFLMLDEKKSCNSDSKLNSKTSLRNSDKVNDFSGILTLKRTSNQIVIFNPSNYFDNIPTNNSFFIFSKRNVFRIACCRINKNNYFDKMIISFIIASTFKLAIETFYDKKDPSSNKFLKRITLILSCSINIFFTFVIIIKTVTLGVIFENKSFCRDKLNVVNFFAVLGFYLNIIWKDSTSLESLFTVILLIKMFLIISIFILIYFMVGSLIIV